MATPEDLQANADYIRMADQYVEVCDFSLQLTGFFVVLILKAFADSMVIGSRGHK